MPPGTVPADRRPRLGSLPGPARGSEADGPQRGCLRSPRLGCAATFARELGFSSILTEQHEVISVDDLIVGGSADRFTHLFAAQTADAFDIVGRIIAQTASEFDAIDV